MIPTVLHRRMTLRPGMLALSMVLLAGLLPAAAYAAGTWKSQTSGTTSLLSSVTFPDASHGWVVGDSGTILATSDGGTTWSAQNSGSDAALNAVSFPDANHGWAVGTGQNTLGNLGTILATTDGGATWTTQHRYSGTYYDLVSVAFTDATNGWVVGGRGMNINSPGIFPTADGGATWTAQKYGTADDLRSVAFTDGTHGWAVGTGGTILTTDDGGTSWRAETSNAKDSLNSVAFINRSHGWAVGENGTIIVYNTAPAPVASTSPSRGWLIAGMLFVLAIVGGLVLALGARRRKVSNGVGASGGLPSDPYAQERIGGGPGALAGATAGSEKVWYCTECGSPVRGGSAFCASCGAKTAR